VYERAYGALLLCAYPMMAAGSMRTWCLQVRLSCVCEHLHASTDTAVQRPITQLLYPIAASATGMQPCVHATQALGLGRTSTAIWLL